ncbi:MAG: hypothetical protein ACON4X_07360 [Polaribacter sp.]
MLKKVISYVYIIGGLSLIILGVMYFLEDRESYRLIFGFETISKYNYLIFRLIFGALVIWAGIARLKRKETL